MERIEFGIVGGGWRAEFYLRIARACPAQFAVAGMVVRAEEKGKAIEAKWGVPTFRTLDEMLAKCSPRFVVTSVPWPVNPVMLKELAARGVPALSETPPAPDLAALIDLWEAVAKHGGKVQVAEQYHLQPLLAARLAVAASGKLGQVSQAQVSFCHGYHGVSLLRRFLGVRFEDAAVRAFVFKSPIIAGPSRNGPPVKEELSPSKPQQFAFYDFGDRLGVSDFTGDQYMSWIRGKRILVRGERGELTADTVVYLKDYLTPVELRFVRHAGAADGNLEGNYLKGVQLGDEWLFRNPFAPAPLTDEEIAVAGCLARMDEYVATGRDFYSLAEASQDHYLSLLANEAAKTGAAVRSARQPWAG